MPLQDLLKDQFQVRTRPIVNKLTDQAETSATLLLSNNPNRLAWTIVNLGANPVYIALDNDVSQTKGILVAANGGSVSMVWNEDFDMVAWSWYGIALSSACKVYIVEIVEV
jgi:hypothetical protein